MVGNSFYNYLLKQSWLNMDFFYTDAGGAAIYYLANKIIDFVIELVN